VARSLRSLGGTLASTSQNISSAYRKPDTCRQRLTVLNSGVASNQPAETAARRRRSAILAALVSISAVLIGVASGRLLGPWLARGEAVGAVGRGLTVFDHDRPAIANLDPALLRALRQAAKAAARDRVKIHINSGWRSPEYQERLHLQAVWKYRSQEKAARWVATADTSSHVSGHAVDIGPGRAVAWLSRHGREYRLCQIYRNEPWHYELRPEANAGGCPPMYTDPRHDPRMQE
jgi:zinc D-Ala-D-Ala carboxypeptidase